MTSQAKQVKKVFQTEIALQLDSKMSSYGFSRRSGSLIYARGPSSYRQSIDMLLEHRPVESPGSKSVVAPMYSIVSAEINECVNDMCDGQRDIIGNPKSTLRGPIEWNSCKIESARWYISQDRLICTLVPGVLQYIIRYTVPFLNRLNTVGGVAAAVLDGDCRDAHTESDILRVIAANYLIKKPEKAIEIFETRFGKRAGTRKKYKSILAYLGN